ncbi:MAG: ABC transporter ATP-binding protein [Microbacteriaceae bacterium]|nr:ABC transporter ATP-binding protein [Microbacteriaceae bacterium]
MNLKVSDLNIRYGDIHAVVDLSFELPKGEILAIIGSNGSGKSSLLAAVSGQMFGESGEVAGLTGSIEWQGEDVKLPRSRGEIAYVAQSEHIDVHFPINVREIVSMGRFKKQGMLRLESEADSKAIDIALARAGITDLADRSLLALSGGQRKRVFVARGLATDAPLMLLDEPFAGVDVESEVLIIELLVQLASEGKTILIATHNLPTIKTFADKVLAMKNRMLAFGTPEEVTEIV